MYLAHLEVIEKNRSRNEVDSAVGVEIGSTLMQPRRGLPPRPSVPPGLQTQDSSYLQNVDPQQQAFNIGAMAAQVLTSSLANPYGQMSSAYSYTNANFHSYFTQGPRLMTTPQGYTFSSTYVPNAGGPSPPQSYSWPQPQRGRIPNVHSTNRPSRPRYESQIYTPGDSKCTYDGCSFIGSKKTVEIHMMDRHLIFPPGWKKKTDDWDADPALKGFVSMDCMFALEIAHSSSTSEN